MFFSLLGYHHPHCLVSLYEFNKKVAFLVSFFSSFARSFVLMVFEALPSDIRPTKRRTFLNFSPDVWLSFASLKLWLFVNLMLGMAFCRFSRTPEERSLPCAQAYWLGFLAAKIWLACTILFQCVLAILLYPSLRRVLVAN